MRQLLHDAITATLNSSRVIVENLSQNDQDRRGCSVQRLRLRLLASLVVMMFIASAPGSAAAFGTIDTGGQRREHERVTRAALSCAGDAGSDPYCFEPTSIDYLAGHAPEFGAVGAPDSDELSDPAAHCDNADFLEGEYPRTRNEATASVVACVNHMRMRFGEGVDAAQGPGLRQSRDER
jgi:hypothetical protein